MNKLTTKLPLFQSGPRNCLEKRVSFATEIKPFVIKYINVKRKWNSILPLSRVKKVSIKLIPKCFVQKQNSFKCTITITSQIVIVGVNFWNFSQKKNLLRDGYNKRMFNHTEDTVFSDPKSTELSKTNNWK